MEMLRRDGPFDSDTSSFAGSLRSNGYSTMDDVSSLASGLSRPSGKSIYLQRKEYATSINKTMDKFEYRVEHLFTCDLDGRELRSVMDCVERLKLLDQMGRVWGQDMLLEVRGAHLVLTDIETKEELESVSLSDIQDLKAVLNTGVFNSLLTVAVQQGRKHSPTVFLFQCDDVRADYVERNLVRALSGRRDDPGVRSGSRQPAGPDRTNVVRSTAAAPEVKEQQEAVEPQWGPADYDEPHYDDLLPPQLEEEVEEEVEEQDEAPLRMEDSAREEDPLPPHRPYTELDRDVDVLNHILYELEVFMGRVAAVEAKNTKKKKKKKKKKGKELKGMPSVEEFAETLHKIKYGFNILAVVNGHIDNPSAPEFVHSLFSALAFVVSHCPRDLPPSIVAPLLTPQSVRLMSEEASEEEDQLWQSLGEAWNIPSTQWPQDDEDVPAYDLRFFNGWQPADVNGAGDPAYCPAASQREPSRGRYSPGTSPHQSSQRSPRRARSFGSKPRVMRVKFDFMSRNHKELTVIKGELVDLLDMSKQWWKVRNGRGEEGYVPNNLLEDPELQADEFFEASPVLTKKSKPAEVKAWLVDKGFSEITVRCLGVLSGSMLLGMPREELKMVCPEEGGRVFFQLQAVKSSLLMMS